MRARSHACLLQTRRLVKLTLGVVHHKIACSLLSTEDPCYSEIAPYGGPVPDVPTISSFYGILIQMYWHDHAPPHFHALYAEDEALIDIHTLEVIQGQLPRRALALVLEWAQAQRAELLEDWESCSHNQQPKKIRPLI